MQTFWIIITALAFNAAALAFMFFYFRRLVRRTLALDEVLDRARDEIGGMIAEMNQTTDRNVSLIEDRIAKAMASVEMAEKRFGALSLQSVNRSKEREIFERLSRAGSAMSLSSGSGAVEKEPSQSAAVPPPRLAEQAERARPEEAMPSIEKRLDQVDTEMPLHERVVLLWEQGFSSELIAPKLGMTIAETDLIIAMEEQRRLLGR
jgi:hypothetical protein